MLNIARALTYNFHFAKKCFSNSTSSTLQPKKRLEGQVAVITGGASGIGKATVQLFAAEGANVVIADIQDELGEHLAESLPGSTHYVRCDVTKEAEVAKAVDFAVSKYGSLDIMFNNAGVMGPLVASVTQIDAQEFDQLMAVNLRGMLLGTKHAARVMITAKKGSIICTSSIASFFGGCAPHPYAISKAAITGMVKSVASELCTHGIRVNSISPGAIPTPLAQEVFSKAFPSLTAESIADAMSRASGFAGAKFEAEDIARAAVFLASEDARYISGHNLVVDGSFSVSKVFNPFSDAFPKAWHV